MNMKELAAICKVSPATVSYALRDDSRISEKLRLRIQKKARELNYRADAHNSALVRYRSPQADKVRQATVGILYAHPRTSRRTKLIQPHIKSFRSTLSQYGYAVKEYFLGNHSKAQANLIEQLKADETQGLMLAWGDWGDRLDGFPWSDYSVVLAGRDEIHPALDRVSVNHSNATEMAFNQMKKLGAKRIGLICHDDTPIRVKKNIIGAYQVHTHNSDASVEDIRPFSYRLGESSDRIQKWFQRHKLDAILSHRKIELSYFRKAGIHFPKDALYAVLEIDDDSPSEESGIIMNSEFGQVVAEALAGKLHYEDKVNLQSEGILTLVDGQWRDRATTQVPIHLS